jgi:hypothetical protein
MTTVTKSFSEKIFTNLSQLLAVALLLLVFVGYFIKGGIPIGTKLTNWLTTATLFAFLINVFLMTQIQINRLRQRQEMWIYSIVFFITFILISAVGFIYGSKSLEWAIIYDIFYSAGTGGALAMSGLCMIMSVNRSMLPKHARAGGLILFFVIGLFSIMPIGLLVPAIKAPADWMMDHMFGIGEQAGRVALSIGEAAIIARVIAFNEKFRPGE